LPSPPPGAIHAPGTLAFEEDWVGVGNGILAVKEAGGLCDRKMQQQI
jgi:hypothetical protein